MRTFRVEYDVTITERVTVEIEARSAADAKRRVATGKDEKAEDIHSEIVKVHGDREIVEVYPA